MDSVLINMDPQGIPTVVCASLDLPSDTPCCGLKQEDRTITSLPVDALFQIAMRLDCPSLLTMRVTCKAFYAVVEMRQIWQTLVRDLESYTAPPLEESLAEYTTVELAQWVLKRTRTRDICGGLMAPTLRIRTLSIPPHSIPELLYRKLLPGGRWLLVGRLDTTIHFYDLASAQPEPRLLYDPRKMAPEIVEGPTVHHSVWIDWAKPRLSFRIGSFISSALKPLAWIYQVELVGNGPDATLSATRFRYGSPGISPSPTAIMLNDKYLLGTWENLEMKCAEVLIAPYIELPGPSGSCFLLPISRPGMGMIAGFIHQNTFVLEGWDGLRSFHLYEVTADTGSVAPSIQLLHKIPMSHDPFLCLRFVSEIYWSPDSSRMVMLTNNRLKGITIPHDKALTPTLVDLGEWVGPSIENGEMVLGICASVIKDEMDDSVKIIPNRWNSASKGLPGLIPISFRDSRLGSETMPFGLNEDIGRVVFWEIDSLLIVDPV